MRPIDEIIIHCSATRPEWMQGHTGDAKAAEIKRWHVEGRGWSDIGYHMLIDRDGRVFKGRSMARDGAHTRGRNKGTIGVCLIGGHGSAQTDEFSEHFTYMQDKALRGVLADLEARYGANKVSAHHDYANKACPGFKVDKWLAQEKPQPPAVKPSLFATLSKVFASLFTKARK